MAWLDEHDTRGVAALRVQLTGQAKDISDNTVALAGISVKLDSAVSARRQQYLSIGLALMPIYVLLFLSLFHVSPVG